MVLGSTIPIAVTQILRPSGLSTKVKYTHPPDQVTQGEPRLFLTRMSLVVSNVCDNPGATVPFASHFLKSFTVYAPFHLAQRKPLS